ncbi:MAG: hypothetical protein ACYCQJ_14930 [Nitrososphaerales archaeon]
MDDNFFGRFDNDGESELEVLRSPAVDNIFRQLGLEWYATDHRNKIRYYVIPATAQPQNYETVKHYEDQLRTAYELLRDTDHSLPGITSLMTAIHISCTQVKIEE